MIKVAGVIGKGDFSVPEEFETYSKGLFKKESITEREFVDFCLLATRLVDEHWDKRQGLAYHIAGAWLNFENISKNDLLDEIGSEFGTLELPDHHAAGTEEQVKKKWDKVKKLVAEADEMITKS